MVKYALYTLLAICLARLVGAYAISFANGEKFESYEIIGVSIFITICAVTALIVGRDWLSRRHL